MMIKLDEFNEIMATKFTSLLISSSSIVASVNIYKSSYKEEYCYNIHIKEADDRIHRFTFITFTSNTTTDHRYVVSIFDINSNPIIEYDADKREYIVLARQTNSPYYVRRALVYLMNLINTSPNVTMSKEKRKMIKQQKKKVYPNLFERPGVNAGIKDVQIRHKNDKTTITVVWTDLDEKGKNKITTVSCPTRCATIQTGIAMALAKRYFGGRNVFKRVAEDVEALNTKRATAREHRAEVKAKKKEIRGH